MSKEKIPTNREQIENLHLYSGAPRVSIGEELKKVKNDLLQEVALESYSSKVEINAITAFMIEKVWLDMLKEIQVNPPGLGLLKNRGTDMEVFSILKKEEADKVYDRYKDNSRMMLHVLKELSKDFLDGFLSVWIQKMEDASDDINDNSLEKRSYDRLAFLLANERSDTVRVQMLRGLNTAILEFWGTTEAIPIAYKEKFGRNITEKEFEEISINSRNLIYALAGSHVQVFSQIHFKYKVHPSHSFQDGSFYLREDNGKLSLEIKPEILAKVGAGFDPTVRTGCPAIYSTGPSKRNVIAEMHDWVIDLAKTYYLPVLKD